jgi:glucose/arabinose dehydrogenase
MSNKRQFVSILMTGSAAILLIGFVLLAQQPKLDTLPSPAKGTANVGRGVARPEGIDLKVPPGFTVSLYADNLPPARYITFAPNGDMFVSSFVASTITVIHDPGNGQTLTRRVYAQADSNAPRGGGGGGGGGARRGGPSPSDTAAAAVPCTTQPVPTGTTGIFQPQGMAFLNSDLYIANTDSIVRYKYTNGDMEAKGKPDKLVDLISGTDHRWRNVVFNPAGTKMYVSVGSGSNNDAGEDCRRAAILEFNPDGTAGRIFASGLRNPEGMAWQPGTNPPVLWTAVNERDNLGDDLPPDYITSVIDGGFYGWPYSYIGQHYDPRYVGGMTDLVKKTIVPDVLIQAHSAAIGLTFYNGTSFPQHYRNGAFVGLHGSWNRSTASGYKVIFVPFTNGKPGPIEDFLTGFIVDPAAVTKWGRPTGVTVGKDGSLFVADDQAVTANGTGGRVWKVSYTGGRGGR